MSIGKIFFGQCTDMQNCQDQLTAQDPVQISAYTKLWNCKEYKADAYTDTDDTILPSPFLPAITLAE